MIKEKFLHAFNNRRRICAQVSPLEEYSKSGQWLISQFPAPEKLRQVYHIHRRGVSLGYKVSYRATYAAQWTPVSKTAAIYRRNNEQNKSSERGDV